MNEDFDINIIDEEEVEIVDVDFVPVLESPNRKTFNFKSQSRYVSKILVNYVILYLVALLVIMNFLSELLNPIITNVAKNISLSPNNIMAIITALLLVIFNVISIIIGIKSNAGFRKKISIDIDFVAFRAVIFSLFLPTLTAVVSLINFNLYIKSDVTVFYANSFYLLNVLVIIINLVVIFLLKKFFRKIV